MSTGSLGTLGYNDDQPQTAWDDADLWWTQNTAAIGGVGVGPVDCSRWGYTILSADCTAFQGALTLTWTSAQVGGVTLASRTIMLDPLTTAPTQIVMPNMGPWVSGSFAPQAAGSHWTPTVYGLFTNRARPAQAYPQGPVLIDVNTGTLAALASVDEYASDLFAGNCALFIDSGTTAVTIEVKFLSQAFIYDRVFQGSFNASTRQTFNIMLPLCSCLLSITNTSNTTANTGVVARIVPDLVGV